MRCSDERDVEQDEDGCHRAAIIKRWFEDVEESGMS